MLTSFLAIRKTIICAMVLHDGGLSVAFKASLLPLVMARFFVQNLSLATALSSTGNLTPTRRFF